MIWNFSSAQKGIFPERPMFSPFPGSPSAPPGSRYPEKLPPTAGKKPRNWGRNLLRQLLHQFLLSFRFCPKEAGADTGSDCSQLYGPGLPASVPGTGELPVPSRSLPAVGQPPAPPEDPIAGQKLPGSGAAAGFAAAACSLPGSFSLRGKGPRSTAGTGPGRSLQGGRSFGTCSKRSFFLKFHGFPLSIAAGW